MKHCLFIAVLLFCFSGSAAGPISTTVHIEFTHPGDDGVVGMASLIEWKWTADTTLSWNQWAMITDTITPLVSPTIDTAHFEIEFPGEGEYYIAVRAADEVPNWSERCPKIKVVLYDQEGPSCSPASLIGVDR